MAVSRSWAINICMTSLDSLLACYQQQHPPPPLPLSNFKGFAWTECKTSPVSLNHSSPYIMSRIDCFGSIYIGFDGLRVRLHCKYNWINESVWHGETYNKMLPLPLAYAKFLNTSVPPAHRKRETDREIENKLHLWYYEYLIQYHYTKHIYIYEFSRLDRPWQSPHGPKFELKVSIEPGHAWTVVLIFCNYMIYISIKKKKREEEGKTLRPVLAGRHNLCA